METTKIKSINCFDCKNEVIDYQTTIGNNEVCQKCLDENYFSCEGCGEYENTDNRNSCDSCENNWCDDCNPTTECELCRAYYCERCDSHYQNECHENDNDDNIPYRKNDTKEKKFLDKINQGAIIKSIRTFGIEIETYYPDIYALDMIAEKAPKALGIANDGSLNSNGIELQTPLLSGKSGERFVKFLSNLLSKHKFYVDSSCGLHIHIDGKGYTKESEDETKNLRKLWLFYYIYDDVILAMLPASRRNNRFCIPLKKNYNFSEILNCYTKKDIEKKWYKTENEENIKDRKKDKNDTTRYNGINLHALLWDEHLEIRYHSGTINDRKILEWINLHARILDKMPELTISVIQKGLNLLTLTQKMDEMFILLQLEKSSEDYLRNRITKFYPSLADENKLLASIK